MADKRNHYDVLQIASDAEFGELRKAYRARALESHPDRFSGDPAKADEFRRVAEAFNTLSDPILRRNYDLMLGAVTIAPDQPGMTAGFEDAESILDTSVDDTLEELIVGNTVPTNTTLQTLMLDLEKTEQFCLFREAKTRLFKGDIIGADALFRQYLSNAPENILALYFHAQCCIKLNRWSEAVYRLRLAIALGSARKPPLQLNRIRRELSNLNRKRPGILGALYRLFVPAVSRSQDLPYDEQERRALNRAINRLARERLNAPRDKKQLNEH